MFTIGGSGYGWFDGVSERWCAVCVVVVCGVGLSLWVAEFHAFGAGCFVRARVRQGFVVWSFVGDGSGGCGVVKVRVCAGY